MSLQEPDLMRFVRELEMSRNRWAHLVRHSSSERVYRQIWDTPEANAWLICWSEDQDTGYHDHDDSAAGIRVIEGHVREDRLRLDGGSRSRMIGPGAAFFVPPTAIHRVLHTGLVPAVTIHAYSPPLRRTGAYWTGPGGELERTTQPLEQELRPVAVMR